MKTRIPWKKKKKVRFRYSAQADAYDELYSDEQRAKCELVLSRFIFSGEERILDSGCGTGIFIEQAAGKVKSVVGVDFSAWMLRKAKLKLGKKSNVDLVCADFDYLPFLEGWFTHIFMLNALPDPAYWDHAIRQALRVLGIEGGISLSVPKKEISRERLLGKLGKLRECGLELRELINDRITPDYLVVSQRAQIEGEEGLHV